MSLLKVLKLPLPPTREAPPASAKNSAEVKTTLPSPQTDRLFQAAETWRQTHRQANERIAALKAAIQGHYANGHPELLKEIETGLGKLDQVLNNVDHRLADSLASASAAADDGTRKAELKTSKSILTEYIAYVKSEPLVAHMDQNPFGVRTDLRALLSGGLTGAAKAMT